MVQKQSTARVTVTPIRTIREARGMTLAELAEKASVNLGHLSRIETGQVNLTVPTLYRLAEALGLREFAKILRPYVQEKRAVGQEVAD